MLEFTKQSHKITIILGSITPNGYTEKAAKLVAHEFNLSENIEAEIIYPADFELTFPGQKANRAKIDEFQSKVKESSGVILATPEYHGTFSALLKLAIENLGYPSALSGKPVGLLGVASGEIGAVKSLEHLRSVCSHIGALVLPGPVSIANVDRYFDDEGNCTNELIEKRVRALAVNMLKFISDHINPKAALEELVRKRKISG